MIDDSGTEQSFYQNAGCSLATSTIMIGGTSLVANERVDKIEAWYTILDLGWHHVKITLTNSVVWEYSSNKPGS